MTRRLPVGIAIAATYETFLEAPIAFTLVSIAGLSGFVATVLLALTELHTIQSSGPDVAWAMRAAAPLAYVLFIFCMGLRCLAARQIRSGEPCSIVAAAAGSLRRLEPALLASLPIFVTIGLLLYDLQRSRAWAGCSRPSCSRSPTSPSSRSSCRSASSSDVARSPAWRKASG